MKQNKWLIPVAVLSVVLFTVLCYMVFFSTPVRPRLEYYSDSSNFITATGKVTHIGWSSDQSYVYIAFDDIPEEYSDTNFVIEGENLRIVLENGFAEKVKLGSEVIYISAPRYFWDGYSMPIVELSVDGAILLTFEQGKTNLLDMIQH